MRIEILIRNICLSATIVYKVGHITDITLLLLAARMSPKRMGLLLFKQLCGWSFLQDHKTREPTYINIMR
jgi:hypothetical protein